MTAATRISFAAALVSAAIGFAPVADAAWWNPFRRDREPEPQQQMQLPAPPESIGQGQIDQGNVTLIQDQQALDPAGRIERMEAQMRTMTGQIEELTFQLRQMQELLQRMQEDTDFRLQELEGGSPAAARPERRSDAAPAAPAQAPAAPPQQDVAAADIPMDAGEPLDDPDEVPMDGAHAEIEPIGPDPGAEVALGAPPRDLGQIPADAAGRPLDLTAVMRQNGQLSIDRPANAGVDFQQTAALSGDVRTDYQSAYERLVSGDYEGAEASFRAFLSSYPGDGLAADAQYWIGESLFTRGLFREAADEFLTAYRSYPSSPKAPDTLLKLGMSLAGLGQRDAACASYAQVLRQFPDASNAVRSKVRDEQATAAC